ncbi:MAG: hypothetical protein ABIQ44_14290, partial [Chloroflexia bacterium]
IHHWAAKCELPDHQKLVGPASGAQEGIERLRGMYDGSESGWILIDLGPDELDGTNVYVPENRETNTGMLVCDDDVYEEIVRRMLEARVPIVKPEEIDR